MNESVKNIKSKAILYGFILNLFSSSFLFAEDPLEKSDYSIKSSSASGVTQVIHYNSPSEGPFYNAIFRTYENKNIDLQANTLETQFGQYLFNCIVNNSFLRTDHLGSIDETALRRLLIFYVVLHNMDGGTTPNVPPTNFTCTNMSASAFNASVASFHWFALALRGNPSTTPIKDQYISKVGPGLTKWRDNPGIFLNELLIVYLMDRFPEVFKPQRCIKLSSVG